MREDDFKKELFVGLIDDCFSLQTNNVDFIRFKSPIFLRLAKKISDAALFFVNGMLLLYKKVTLKKYEQNLNYVVENIDELACFYYMLGDSFSRQLLIQLLRFKILGACHVRLPLNNKNYWEKIKVVQRKYLKNKQTSKVGAWALNRYEIPCLNNLITIDCHPLNILNTFMLKEYAYIKRGSSIEAKLGDVVIDGGGCWGDTALYFSDLVGPGGQVFSFEFDCANLEIFNNNMKRNPELSKRITIIQRALWNKSEQILNYASHGPGSSITDEVGDSQVQTISLDTLLSENVIKRVDFIKLDIEGAELNALHGAERILREFKPRLAISLYHKEDDFITIPAYLNSLNLGYLFYLDHFTIHQEETILFCIPR